MTPITAPNTHLALLRLGHLRLLLIIDQLLGRSSIVVLRRGHISNVRFQT